MSVCQGDLLSDPPWSSFFSLEWIGSSEMIVVRWTQNLLSCTMHGPRHLSPDFAGAAPLIAIGASQRPANCRWRWSSWWCWRRGTWERPKLVSSGWISLYIGMIYHILIIFNLHFTVESNSILNAVIICEGYHTSRQVWHDMLYLVMTSPWTYPCIASCLAQPEDQLHGIIRFPTDAWC